MKRLLFFCLMAGVLAACGGKDGQENDKPQPDPITNEEPAQPEVQLSQTEQIQMDVGKYMDEQLAKPGKVMDIVAGFEFGMNKKKVSEHRRNMARKGVLKERKKSASATKTVTEYVWLLKLSSKKTVDTYLDFKYTAEEERKGAVYQAICNLKTPRGESTSGLIEETKVKFTEWYQEPAFNLPSENGCSHYLWIDGNRHIELKCGAEGVQAVYTDMSHERPEIELSISEEPAITNGNQVDVSDIEHKPNDGH